MLLHYLEKNCWCLPSCFDKLNLIGFLFHFFGARLAHRGQEGLQKTNTVKKHKLFKRVIHFRIEFPEDGNISSLPNSSHTFGLEM